MHKGNRLPAIESPSAEVSLDQWDSEGGALFVEPASAHEAHSAQSSEPPLTNAEIVRLRVRVIALENLVLVLLGQASDAQRGVAQGRAAFISPRPGFTAHPLTLHAAAQINHLVGRAALMYGGGVSGQ